MNLLISCHIGLNIEKNDISRKPTDNFNFETLMLVELRAWYITVQVFRTRNIPDSIFIS
jgi:hypothetical protein